MERTRTLLAGLAAASLALTILPTTAAQGRPSTESRVAPHRVLDVARLPQGAPPRLSWAERRGTATLIHRRSSTTRVTGRVDALAPMGSGHVVQFAGSPPTVRWVAADGTYGRSSWRTGRGLAVSPRGGAVAFTVRKGGVRVIDSAGDRVVRMPRLPFQRRGVPVSVSSDDCVEDATSNGCAVVVNKGGRTPKSWLTSSHGIVEDMPWPITTAGRRAWSAGITRLFDFGSCSVMARSWQTRWRTCRFQLRSISPGRPARAKVLGLPAYADGFGPRELAVLSLREGTVLRRWTSSRTSATYFDQVWEDRDHVLVVTYQAGRWAVVRLGTDGSMEYAVAPRRGSDMEKPFMLQTR